MIDALVELTGLSPQMIEAALEHLSDQPSTLAEVRHKPDFLCEQQSAS